MKTTFQVIDNAGKHGPTTYHEDPKLAAYAYMARLQYGGRTTSLTCHEDGCYTVESAGLMTCTFQSAMPTLNTAELIGKCIDLVDARTGGYYSALITDARESYGRLRIAILGADDEYKPHFEPTPQELESVHGSSTADFIDGTQEAD